MKESELSDEDFDNLTRAVEGKEISTGGFIYTLSLEMGDKERPEIVLANGTRKYWLKFSSDVEIERELWLEYPTVLRYSLLELTHNNPNFIQPRETDYKLPRGEFDRFYKLNLINEFIRSKCR